MTSYVKVSGMSRTRISIVFVAVHFIAFTSIFMILVYGGYCVDRELYKAIDYLREQVRVLIEQQEKDKRILLDNHQRRRLAIKAKRLTRKLLEETTVLFGCETRAKYCGAGSDERYSEC